MSKTIIIVHGYGHTVMEAIQDLQDRLNVMVSEYDFINSITITIDRNETPVSNSTRVYAFQMLKGKA